MEITVLGVPRQGISATVVDLCAIALLAMITRLPLLNSVTGIDMDEGAFAIAARELLHGHLPYLTFFDNKPFGSTAIIAAAMAGFGESVAVLHAVGIAAVATTGGVLYLITRRIGLGRMAAVSAALFYVLFSTRLHGMATLTEILLAPFTAGGVFVLLGQWRRDRQATTAGRRVAAFGVAGLLFGIAIWIKYLPVFSAIETGGLTLLFLLVTVRTGIGEVVACAAIFSVSAALPTVATVLVYWNAGVLPEFWYSNFGFTSSYITIIIPKIVFEQLLNAAKDIWPLVGLAFLLLVPPLRRDVFSDSKRGMRAVVGVWVVAEGIAVCAPLKFWTIYFLMMLPPFCIIASMTIDAVAHRLGAPGKTATLALVFSIQLALFPAVRYAKDTARLAIHPDLWRDVAGSVERNLAPGETFWAVNLPPIIYLLAHADLPTRYAYPNHLIGILRNLAPVDHAAEVRRILDNRPRAIVIDKNEYNWIKEAPQDAPLKSLIKERLEKDYVPKSTIDSSDGQFDVHIFVLKD